MNKKQQFDKLLSGELQSILLFKPILMHFAARFNQTTYGELASDHKVLVESNIRCLEYFDADTVSLISDPYRETSAFGARVEYIPEVVLKGNIDPVLIQELSIDKLEDLTRELVQQMEGQKFILSGGCEIGVNTPIQNLLKMSEFSTKTKKA